MPKSLPAIFLILGLLTGILISAQFQIPAADSPDPYQEFTDLHDSLGLLAEEQNSLQEEILETRKEIEEQQIYSTTDEERLAKMEKLKEKLGLTGGKGQGVKITLDDNSLNAEKFDNEAFCFAADLRDIVNLLRAAKSEAIAINDQRVMSLTPINCLGTSVLVNNIRMLPPFQIYAIHENPDFVISYLDTDKFLPSIHKRVDDGQLIFEYEDFKDISIPVYKGNLSTNYLN